MIRRLSIRWRITLVAAGLFAVALGLASFVLVREVRSKNVQVVGEVTRSGAVVPLTSDMRALDAIAIAGGFSPYADKGDVRILRPNPDGSIIEYRFNYNAFLRGKNTQGNMRLQPGDTIVVPD